MLLLVLGVALTGCPRSDPRGRITGKVTFQGKPVSEGVVLFNNNDKGVHMTAALKPDGSYEVAPKFGGLPVGTYRVCVCPPSPRLPDLESSTPGKVAPPVVREYPNIPQRYRSDETSGLTMTVERGENSFDIDMTP